MTLNGCLSVRWMEKGYDLIHHCGGPPSPRGRQEIAPNILLTASLNAVNLIFF